MEPLSYHHRLSLLRLHHFVHPNIALLLLDCWLLESKNMLVSGFLDQRISIGHAIKPRLLTQNWMLGWFPRWLH